MNLDEFIELFKKNLRSARLSVRDAVEAREGLHVGVFGADCPFDHVWTVSVDRLTDTDSYFEASEYFQDHHKSTRMAKEMRKAIDEYLGLVKFGCSDDGCGLGAKCTLCGKPLPCVHCVDCSSFTARRKK